MYSLFCKLFSSSRNVIIKEIIIACCCLIKFINDILIGPSPLFSAVMTSGIVAVLLLCSVVFGLMYWKKRKTPPGYCYEQLQQDPI